MEQFNPETQKIQYAYYGINGELRKQGFVASYRSLFRSRNRESLKYGGGISVRTLIVPKTQTRLSPMPFSLGPAYCFCADTPLSAHRCSKCGKPPYTD